MYVYTYICTFIYIHTCYTYICMYTHTYPRTLSLSHTHIHTYRQRQPHRVAHKQLLQHARNNLCLRRRERRIKRGTIVERLLRFRHIHINYTFLLNCLCFLRIYLFRHACQATPRARLCMRVAETQQAFPPQAQLCNRREPVAAL